MTPIHIASCSFGKDSIATILLALEHNEPLDRVVFAEVMYDHKRGISGEIPEHIEWIYKTAIPKLEGMGVKIDVVKSDKDYVYYFKTIRQRGAYRGMRYGFPLGGKCIIQSDCKLAPIHKYYRQFANKRVVQYIGIAKNEVPRIARLKNNQISLLSKYGYDESMAMEKCKEYNLVSPIYSSTYRGGVLVLYEPKARGLSEVSQYASRPMGRTPAAWCDTEPLLAWIQVRKDDRAGKRKA